MSIRNSSSETPSLRIVMFGTGPFAVPTFRLLRCSTHDVTALVNQPAVVTRGKPTPPSPMRLAAAELGVEIYDPESINTDEARAWLAARNPDLFVVADYGQILAPATLDVARLGGVNLHGSLLPKYRGAAPINWALMNGDEETGVTVIQMSRGVDAGPCLAQASTPIEPRENAVELEHRLAELGAPLILRIVDDLAAGRATSLPQDNALVTKAPRLKKLDGAIDWTRSAREIVNQVRGLEPWPKTYTHWLRPGGEPLRVILGRVSAIDGFVPSDAAGEIAPGTVVAAAGDQLVVACGTGAARIESLQPAGKRVLSAEEFLRGYPMAPGDRWGPVGT